jgi:drug/metabolite transporter (DMT)-like permease
MLADTIVLGLLSALAWGGGDFSGGLATRRSPVFGVLVVAHGAGLALLVLLALLSGEPFPPWRDLAWGLAAGLVGGLGLAGLYHALATGQMGIISPVVAVMSAAVPALFAALVEGIPGGGQLLGFTFALFGIALVSNPQGTSGRAQGLGLAFLSGLLFGGFLILIDQVSSEAVFWPLAAARIGSITLMISIVRSRRVPLPYRGQLPLVALAGILDVGGNACFVLAAQSGRLDVAAILSSLYPAVTVLLARGVLSERVTRLQTAGILAVLVAVPLIAA